MYMFSNLLNCSYKTLKLTPAIAKKCYSTATAFDVLTNSDPTQARVMVEKINPNGFTVNGVKMAGSIAVFPRSSFIWRVCKLYIYVLIHIS